MQLPYLASLPSALLPSYLISTTLSLSLSLSLFLSFSLPLHQSHSPSHTPFHINLFVFIIFLVVFLFFLGLSQLSVQLASLASISFALSLIFRPLSLSLYFFVFLSYTFALHRRGWSSHNAILFPSSVIYFAFLSACEFLFLCETFY